MNRSLIIALFLLAAPVVHAQNAAQPVTIDDLLTGAEEWAKENLDVEVLELLEDIDRDRVRGFLVDLEARLQTNSVYELAPLRRQAKEIVPFLEQWEETLPLAQWLRTRLDYLDVADELNRAQPRPKDITIIKPPPPLPLQRTTWKRQFERRAVPAKADSLVPKLKQIFIAEKTPPELVWVAE